MTSPYAPAASEKLSVLLVDDHPLVRHGLGELLRSEPDLCLFAEAATPDEALAAVATRRPDLAIVDLMLGEADGLDLVKSLLARHPDLPVLVCSMHNESVYAERALRAGARGYVMKQEPNAAVLAAIRRVLSGQIHVGERVASNMLLKLVNPQAAGRQGGVQQLSDREFEVFSLLGRGAGPSEIARQLGVSVKTVETHREHIKRKLRLPNGRELLRAAMLHAGAAPAPAGRAPSVNPRPRPARRPAAPGDASDSGTSFS